MQPLIGDQKRALVHLLREMGYLLAHAVETAKPKNSHHQWQKAALIL